jgi:hypothetical protein
MKSGIKQSTTGNLGLRWWRDDGGGLLGSVESECVVEYVMVKA